MIYTPCFTSLLQVTIMPLPGHACARCRTSTSSKLRAHAQQYASNVRLGSVQSRVLGCPSEQASKITCALTLNDGEWPGLQHRSYEPAGTLAALRASTVCIPKLQALRTMWKKSTLLRVFSEPACKPTLPMQT